MKKLLLLFFIFLSISISAQVNQNVTPYHICNTTSSQFGVFNLTSKTAEILGNLDPAIHTVIFYQTSDDAINGTNPITNAAAFTNTTAGTQYIYVAVTNTSTNQVEYTVLTLLVSSANAGSDGSITICESSIATVNLFDLIVGELPGGIWVRTTGTGGTFNAAAGTYTPDFEATTSTFDYRSGSGSCIDNSLATINITPQPNAGSDGSITVCETNTTPINLFSLLTNEEPGGIWVRTTGTGGTFNAAAGTYTPASGATSSTFTYTLVGTAPCINDSSSAIVNIIDCTTLPVCGGTFVDSGGASGNYSNNENQTTVICPSATGDVVKLTFMSFDTEADSDVMHVYNGISAIYSEFSGSNPAVLTGSHSGYSGTAIPGPFTATNTNGCLTVVFTSNGINTSSGWVANVDYIPGVCSPPLNLSVSQLSGTSATINWSNGGSETAWEIIILPSGSPSPTGPGIPINSNTFTAAGLYPDGCYIAYVRSLCPNGSSDWSSINFCMHDCENNGQCPESLNLVAFLDSNTNGIKDANESVFNYGTFAYQVNSGNTIYGYTNSGGLSIFESNPANSYNISFEPNPDIASYFSSSATYSNITVPAGSGTNTYYFPVTQLQEYNDLEVQLVSYGSPRPGFEYVQRILYRNKGTQNVASGTVNFLIDPALSITDVSQSGTTNTPTGFSYNFTDLAPNELRTITITMQVPNIPSVSLTQLLTNRAFIEPISGDAYTADNIATLSQTIVGSYDPNNKMELHGGKIVQSTFSSNDYLYYTINFENTGTSSAEFIRVTDALDSKLDETTFQMLNASHNVNTKLDGNNLTWHFYNINLPPTATNPTESHGSIQFKIKPKPGYAVGDVIPNSASIYFEYNPPITTDSFDTEFVQSLRNPDFNSNAISLYPNPATDRVTITNNNGIEKISVVVIYDVSGKKVYVLNNNPANTIQIDVSHFAKGLYLVELSSEANLKTTKKLIIK